MSDWLRDKEVLSDGWEPRVFMERGYFTDMRTLGRIRVFEGMLSILIALLGAKMIC